MAVHDSPSTATAAPAPPPPSPGEISTQTVAVGTAGRPVEMEPGSSDGEGEGHRDGGEDQYRRRRCRQVVEEDEGGDGDDEGDDGDEGGGSDSESSASSDDGQLRRKRTRLSVASGAWQGSPVGSIDSPRQLVHHLSPRARGGNAGGGSDSDGATFLPQTHAYTMHGSVYLVCTRCHHATLLCSSWPLCVRRWCDPTLLVVQEVPRHCHPRC